MWWNRQKTSIYCMYVVIMLCYIGGKSVQKTAQDVAELTKDVNVEGKREALLASSDAAQEADRVRRVGGGKHVQGGSPALVYSEP